MKHINNAVFVYVLGSEDIDRLLRIILTNPTLFGGGVAFFLDNTIKGMQFHLYISYIWRNFTEIHVQVYRK